MGRLDSILAISISKRIMRRSFEKASYRPDKIRFPRLNEDVRTYVNIPFCYSKCSFCHFHKELNSETVKEEYLSAILGEIENTDLEREFK
ncbi:MAG: hypothetical protein ACFFBS_02635 [Promethearchaeota archaeon]